LSESIIITTIITIIVINAVIITVIIIVISFFQIKNKRERNIKCDYKIKINYSTVRFTKLKIDNIYFNY